MISQMSFFFFLLICIANGVVGDEVRINDVEEFIKFKDSVNNGTFYAGTTVLLDSDLSLTGKEFEPVGMPSSYFLGTFDGQGHVISDLAMNSSSSQFIGLFRCSMGLTIRGVILDTHSSVTGLYSGSDSAYVGGIVGYCEAYYEPCTIENIVNMGRVSFAGNTDSHLYVGGIAGYVDPSNYEITVKNCANYGDVTHSGESRYSGIGGIVGDSGYYLSTNKVRIYNTLNYGTITHSGTTIYRLDLGEISGYSKNATIENCVSAGKISSLSKASEYNYIGSIVGYVYSDTLIAHCLWTSDVGCDVVNGSGSPEITDTSLIASLDTTTISKLNDYVKINAWSRWVMLHLNGGTISNISQDTQICGLVKSLPVPVKEGLPLYFWCLDEECNEVYNPNTTEVSSVTDLYAHWTIKHTITFEVNGGRECPSITQDYNTEITLPEPNKTGYTFVGWFTDSELTIEFAETAMPAKNLTLYAKWTINQYTITFDFSNGTVNSVVLEFNATIEYPEEMTRERFIFTEWSPEPERVPAENVTVKALWNVTEPTEYVEVVFSEKDLNKRGVEGIIKEFIPEGAEFTIEKIENGPEGTRVIIKFADKEAAKEFVENVGVSSESKKNYIIRTDFAYGVLDGFSPALCHPFTILSLVFAL